MAKFIHTEKVKEIEAMLMFELSSLMICLKDLRKNLVVRQGA